MKFSIVDAIPETQEPAGKRTVRQNIYGNWVGYISGRRFKEFGCQAWAEREATEWAEHNTAETKGT